MDGNTAPNIILDRMTANPRTSGCSGGASHLSASRNRSRKGSRSNRLFNPLTSEVYL